MYLSDFHTQCPALYPCIPVFLYSCIPVFLYHCIPASPRPVTRAAASPRDLRLPPNYGIAATGPLTGNSPHTTVIMAPEQGTGEETVFSLVLYFYICCIIDGTARYMGLLLSPLEGYGRWPFFFYQRRKKIFLSSSLEFSG